MAFYNNPSCNPLFLCISFEQSWSVWMCQTNPTKSSCPSLLSMLVVIKVLVQATCLLWLALKMRKIRFCVMWFSVYFCKPPTLSLRISTPGFSIEVLLSWTGSVSMSVWHPSVHAHKCSDFTAQPSHRTRKIYLARKKTPTSVQNGNSTMCLTVYVTVSFFLSSYFHPVCHF